MEKENIIVALKGKKCQFDRKAQVNRIEALLLDCHNDWKSIVFNEFVDFICKE